jgi:hypothetical protein
MICNVVSCVVCKYSMLNGVIDSREVRRVKSSRPLAKLKVSSRM